MQIGQVSTDVISGLGVFVQPGQLGISPLWASGDDADIFCPLASSGKPFYLWRGLMTLLWD